MKDHIKIFKPAFTNLCGENPCMWPKVLNDGNLAPITKWNFMLEKDSCWSKTEQQYLALKFFSSPSEPKKFKNL